MNDYIDNYVLTAPAATSTQQAQQPLIRSVKARSIWLPTREADHVPGLHITPWSSLHKH